MFICTLLISPTIQIIWEAGEYPSIPKNRQKWVPDWAAERPGKGPYLWASSSFFGNPAFVSKKPANTKAPFLPRCLVPPAHIILQWWGAQTKMQTNCLPQGLLWRLFIGMCFHQHHSSYHQQTAFRKIERNKRSLPSSSTTTALSARLTFSFYSGRWK